MPAGFQVFDASGNVIVDLTDRLGRVLGITTITADGNLTDAGFATGTPFWCCIPVATGRAPVPDISISGNVLSWDFQAGISYAPSNRLIYGVY